MTALASAILETLQKANQPMTARQIAEQIGRGSKLSKYDKDLIDQMAEDGKIKINKYPAGVVSFRYTYEAI